MIAFCACLQYTADVEQALPARSADTGLEYLLLHIIGNSLHNPPGASEDIDE